MSPRDPNVPRGEFETDTPTGIREMRIVEARVQRLEMRDAVMHGIDGEDGAWHRLKTEHEVIKTRVDVLDGFRGKALLLITLGGTLLGFIAGIAAIFVEKAFK